MTKIAIVSVLAGVVLASSVHAQAPADPPAAAPVLSDPEKAAIDVLAIIAQRDQALKDLGACSAQLAPLQAQVRDGQLRQRIDALRASIEKAHPGYRWDVEKGTLVPVSPKVAAKQ